MKWTLVDEILIMELHRDPCNEIGQEMLAFLESFLDQAPLNASRALIIYSSHPKGFSAGADLVQLYKGLCDVTDVENQRKHIQNYIDRIHFVFNTIDHLSIPTIVVTHGICFGGGFELALTADLIIAESSTRFCFPESRLGLIPGFGGIPRLKRELPNQKIRDLLLTGRSMQAKKLPELISQIVPDGKGLNIAQASAKQMKKFHPEVLAQSKAFIKPNLKLELEKEKKLFMDMILKPHVKQALKNFVDNKTVQPYLP